MTITPTPAGPSTPTTPAAGPAAPAPAPRGVDLAAVVRKVWHHRTEANAAVFFLKNPTRPWLLPFSVETINDSNAATRAAYTKLGLDDGSDAYRHALTAALFVQRLTTEHGVPLDVAHRITRQAGTAHEDDTRGEWLPERRAMDLDNNEVGMTLAPVDAPDRATADRLLHERVIDALASGRLQVFDERYQLRASDHRDLPGAAPIRRAR